EAMNLGAELEGRLLKIVLAELRADLRTQRQRNRAMYQAHYQYYWSAKEPDFARVAEEVYAERKKSEPAVLYVANYLYSGCNRPGRAIDVLYAALEQKMLGEDGQVQLVNYLHGQNRYNESIALLVPWVEKRPDNLNYRVLLLRAYHHSNRR